LRRDRVSKLGAMIPDHDLGAMPCESNSDSLADAAPAARNHEDLSSRQHRCSPVSGQNRTLTVGVSNRFGSVDGSTLSRSSGDAASGAPKIPGYCYKSSVTDCLI
jgi:hypothetical protein